MIKNIAVIDAQGNKYEATWPKRAKGLVKSGRARFVNKTTICLARPPVNTEGTFMATENITELTDESVRTGGDGTSPETEGQPDMAYIMQKIDQILADSQYLRDAIAQFENVEDSAARGLASAVEARENTNRRMIGLLEKMLDSIKPQPLDPGTAKLEALQKFLESSRLEENHKFDILNQAIQRLF